MPPRAAVDIPLPPAARERILGPVPRSVSPVAPYAAASYGRPPEAGREEAGSPAQREADQVKDALELSPEAQAEVARLRAVDAKVRAHEAAHMAAGGGLVRGGASYQERRGPDGRSYAVAGEVSLDTSAVPDNPQATLAKARQIQAAALAPAEPSGQDRAVAAQAARMAAEASVQVAAQAETQPGPRRPSLDLLA